MLKKEIYQLAEILENQIEKRMLSDTDPVDVYRRVVLLRFFQDKENFTEQFYKGLKIFLEQDGVT
jgi:hypothetical protein